MSNVNKSYNGRYIGFRAKNHTGPLFLIISSIKVGGKLYFKQLSRMVIFTMKIDLQI